MKANSSLLLPLVNAYVGFSYASQNLFADQDEFQSTCNDIASKLSIEHVDVQFSQFVAGGTNLSLPDLNVTCGAPWTMVPADICRIAIHVATSNSSGIVSEAWLPSNWTGRFLGTGNGGLNGCLDYASMAYGASLGFATVGGNNGHNGTSGGALFNQPEIVADFAYRSLHTSVVTGKEITEAFYGSPHTKAYYLGCSTGGRQGFKEAQDFPDDFDGIVAGAPAVNFNNLNSWSGHFYPITGNSTADTFISQELWQVIHEDVMKQCDKIDGVLDNILEDPALCIYNPEGLVCTGNQTENCLTPIQANTVLEVFSPMLDSKGNVMYPRLQPGVEVEAFLFAFNGQPAPYAYDWFRYVVYNDLSWDPATLNVKDYEYSENLNPSDIATWKGDLSAARDSNLKILHYHGLADPIISSTISPRYYDHVRNTMGISSDELDSFYRFFELSGTSHCAGGEGASVVGQRLASVESYDPSQNVLMAIVDWVENGNAPETITGTRWVNGTQSLGIDYQRRHCKYPKRNTFKGGDAKDPDNWECVDRE